MKKLINLIKEQLDIPVHKIKYLLDHNSDVIRAAYYGLHRYDYILCEALEN